MTRLSDTGASPAAGVTPGEGQNNMAADDGAQKPGPLRRFVPLILIVAALATFFLLGLDRYLSFEVLGRNRQVLMDFVVANGLASAVGFIVIYAVATAASLPGGALLTLMAGFLFGTVAASFYVVIGATIGATGAFLAARTALGDVLRKRAGNTVRRMEAGFRENAMSYLLFLRLVPVFPFWLVSLVPAFLNVPLRTYVVGTLIGIIPGSVIYASVGNGLGGVFDEGGTPDLGIIFRPEILLPILGLGVLALIPVVYKKIKGRSGPNKGAS
jgi:uncharacterized membrane protein YdjX (TVP38/TMEM64 family)